MVDRVDQFYIGQTWQSPRGTKYIVVGFRRGFYAKQAVLQTVAISGRSRKICRAYDDVVDWVLVHDTEVV